MDLFDGRYRKEELLGQGAFSEVWKVEDTQTGVTLALKVYNPSANVDDDGNEMLTHEFALMVNANHKNLVRPLFFATCNKRPYLILPFCKQGNIGKMIGKMNEDEAWKLLRDCASALAYLHAMNPPILHQDIKPANILLGENDDYMLTDFGVSTQLKKSLSRVSNQEKVLFSAGTISYMAPERFSKHNLPIMANDIYSLGATIYEMLSGMLPFGDSGGLLQNKGAEVPELPGDFSPLLKRILEKCLEAEPWARPTATQLEEIANDALKYPQTRNEIPATLSSATYEEAPQNQQNTIDIQSYTEEPFFKTDSIKGNSQKGRGKILWIVIAAAVAVVIGCGMYILSGINTEEEEQIVVIDPLEQQKMQEEEEFEAAMALFNSESPDSVKKALDQMIMLADNGNKDAIFQVAYTYARTKEYESNQRKKHLEWIVDDKEFFQSDKYNREAIRWLERAIEEEVPNYHQCMYWLASYYYLGIGTAENENRAKNILQKAKEVSEENQDSVFKEKIEETLNLFNREH